MSLSKKTSVQIAQQLPEFVRDDPNYQNFVLFLEAYYEWLETQYTANANSTIVINIFNDYIFFLWYVNCFSF